MVQGCTKLSKCAVVSYYHICTNLLLSPQISVKAKYNYTAQNADELTFPRHAIIQNVNKVEEKWWKGDYGGSRQYWFPANYVEEIQPEDINEGVCFAGCICTSERRLLSCCLGVCFII